MNYNNMKPGQEMDALVAEKVMGWTIYDPRENPEYYEPGGRVYGQPVGRIDDVAREIPKLSTDIGAAWMVVEKMREMGKYVSVECYSGKSHEIFPYICDIEDTATNAKTAPWAICVAALREVSG